MEVIILKDADKIAEEGARRVCALIRQRPNSPGVGYRYNAHRHV